jgi:hypothetical protein
MRERETQLRERQQLEMAAMTAERRRQLEPPQQQTQPVGASDGHR